MGYSVDSKEVYKALQGLGKKYKRVENKAVNEATEYVASALKANTPRYRGKKRGDYILKHAKDHVTYSKSRDGYAEAGYDSDVAWRIHFIEYGTIHQPPQGFVQRTEHEVENQVTEIVAKNIQKGLGL